MKPFARTLGSFVVFGLALGCTAAREKPRAAMVAREAAQVPRPSAPFACSAEHIAELTEGVGKVGPADKAAYALAVLEQRCGADPRWPAATRLGPEGLRAGLIALAEHDPSAWQRLCPGLSAATVSRSDLPACHFEAHGMRGEDALRYWNADDGEERAALRALMLGLVGVAMGDHGGLDPFIPMLLHPDDRGPGLPVDLALVEIEATPTLPPEGREVVEEALRVGLAPCYWETRAQALPRTRASLAATITLDVRGDLLAVRVTDPSDPEVASCVRSFFEETGDGAVEAEVRAILSPSTGLLTASTSPATPPSAVEAAEVNAALATAAACLRGWAHPADAPESACVDLLAAQPDRIRYPELEGSAKPGAIATTAVELLQPHGGWARFQEPDGAFHGFVWVGAASLYLGYASWYGEREGFVVQVPGSAGLLVTGGPPVVSPRAGRIVGAEVDPFSDNELRVRAYAIGSGAPAALRHDALYVGGEAERVVAIAFTDDDRVRVDLAEGEGVRGLRVDLGPADFELGPELSPLLEQVRRGASTLDTRRPLSGPVVVLCDAGRFAPLGALQAVERVRESQPPRYRYALPCEASWAFAAELIMFGFEPPRVWPLGSQEPIASPNAGGLADLDPGGPYAGGERVRTLGDLVYRERAATDQDLPYGKRCTMERGAHRVELGSSYGCQLMFAGDLNADGRTDAIVHTGDDGCEQSRLYLSNVEGWAVAALRDCGL